MFDSDPDLAYLQEHVALFSAAISIRCAAGADRISLVADLERAQRSIAERTHSSTPPAALDAFARWQLSVTEQHALLLLAAIALSAELRQATCRVTGEVTSDPTFGGIRALVHGLTIGPDSWRELSLDGRLVRLQLIERSDGNAEVHESRRTWAISTMALFALQGVRAISRDVTQLAAKSPPLATDSLAVDAHATARVCRALGQTSPSVLVVSATPGSGRRTLIHAVARERGLDVLDVDARKLSHERNTCAIQLARVARDCILLGRIPLIANVEVLAEGEQPRLDLFDSELFAHFAGPVAVTCGLDRPAFQWNRPAIIVELGAPTFDQRARLWRTTLGQGTQQDAEHLANQYPLAPGLIHRAAAAAKARAAGEKLTPEDIYAGIRTVLDDRLGDYARRVTVTQTWDDLVLPQEQVDAIVELMARVRQRRKVYEQWGFGPKVGKGLGVSALFSGPPGTGKTMVAALIARDLGLELYQVDPGKIMSKWIGETEKNLGALFDAAEAAHAILLFDEADALFGKRTEVKSSNDRHANLETNYLLQRLESFTGICLLTSNHESNIDPAFQRRLSLHLRFELPDEVERAHLWRAMIPAAAPVAPDVDMGSLAKRFAMSGGYIRNAALRAAFLAADEGSAISSVHLERAARLEYEGMGKIAV
ncbi:MAG TPA: ATP-binding protein [Kofleriaceae bacterium]|nr:ATP-binding protein [Kofleriaceae bacterium]